MPKSVEFPAVHVSLSLCSEIVIVRLLPKVPMDARPFGHHPGDGEWPPAPYSGCMAVRSKNIWIEPLAVPDWNERKSKL